MRTKNMKASRNVTLLSLAALALFVAVPAAKADIISTATLAPTTTDFTGLSLNVAQFNPSLGTLNSVTITLNGGNSASTTVKNDTANATGSFTLNENTQLTLSSGLAGVSSLAENLSKSYPGINIA